MILTYASGCILQSIILEACTNPTKIAVWLIDRANNATFVCFVMKKMWLKDYS